MLEKRGEAAREIDLQLKDAERAMLASIPADQLQKIIANTKVKPEYRAVFLGAVGKLMLAVLIGGAFVAFMTPSLGHTLTPEERERFLRNNPELSKVLNDVNDPNEAEPDSEVRKGGRED